MHTCTRLLTLSLLWLLAASVHAAPPASVEALISPAWLERAGTREPLAAGMSLAAGDRLLTGPGGSLRLVLGDGTRLSLGVDGRLSLAHLNDRGDFFDASLQLEQGVLRASRAVEPAGPRHAIDLDLGAFIAGMRGEADLWARRNEVSALLYLQAGEVLLTHPQAGEFCMQQPTSSVESAPGGMPSPILPVEAGRAQEWLAQTALPVGKGLMVPGGGWIVQLVALGREDKAEGLRAALVEAGYPAELSALQQSGRMLHRVRVANFDSQADANQFAERASTRFGVATPWVTCTSEPRCLR